MRHGAFSLADLDESPPKKQGAFSLDDLSEALPAPPKKYLPEVEKALSTVPRPDSALNYAVPGNRVTGALTGYFPTRTPRNGPGKQLPPIPAIEAIKAGLQPLPQSETETIPGAVPGIESAQAAGRGEGWRAGTKAVEAAGQVITPLFGPTLAGMSAAPALGPALKVGAGLAGGTFVGAPAGRAISKAAGASPQQQEFWESLGFFAPQAAGLIAGKAGDYLSKPYEPYGPEAINQATGVFSSLGYKYGVDLPENPKPADVSKAFTELSKRMAEQGEDTEGNAKALSQAYNAIKGNFDVFRMGITGKGWFTPPLPPGGVPPGPAGHRPQPGPIGQSPFGPPPAPPTDPVVEALQRSTALKQAADRVTQGLPPTPPPEPAPEPPPVHEVTPKMVQEFARGIVNLPPEQRAPAMIRMHTEVAAQLVKQGKVVGPDGMLEIVDSPKAADKIVQGWINDAVKQTDKALASVSKGEAKGEEKGAAVPAAAPTTPGRSRAKAQALAEPTKGKFSVEDLTEGVPSKGEQRREESNAPTRAENNVPAVAVPNKPVASADAEPSHPAPTTEAANASGGVRVPGAVAETGGATNGKPAATGTPAALTKGSVVSLKSDTDVYGEKFDKGTPVKIEYVHPNGLTARGVVTDGPFKGRKISRGISAFTGNVTGGAVSIPPSERGRTEATQSGGTSVSRASEQPPVPNQVTAVAKPLAPPAPEKEIQKEAPGAQASGNPPSAGNAAQPTVRGEVPKPEAGAAKPEEAVAKAEVAPTKYKFGNTQAPIHGNSEAAKSLETARARIADEPGKVGEMNVSDLRVAPNKFQYKLSTDAEGVSSLLKETKVFNPDLAGVISVWRDPADGKTYIVNGHHRYELAVRTGQKTVTVRHILAKDAVEARAIGALQNIAEGRGTAVDAAKFFRDSGLTPDHLKEKGISLGEKTAADGLAMSRLDPSIFAKVVSGDLRQGRAIAIGESTADPAEQKAILSLVERKERAGAKVSDGTLSELIRLVKGSGQTTETTANLFGSQEINRSLALEKAEVSDYIKTQLGRDKKLFGFVAKEGRATELARAGNKIDVEKSKEISTGAAQAEEVYNKLSARGGPIASILDDAAKRLADGDNAAVVKSQAYQSVRAEVSKTLQGTEGPGTGGFEAASEAEKGIDLFSGADPLTAPIFYSKAARVAFDKLPSSMSGESALATLKNAGVKADEVKWLGLDDLLKDKPKISKRDVLQHILQNLLQIKEVAKGTANTEHLDELNDRRESIIADLTYNQGYGVDQRGDHYDVALTDHAGNEAWVKYGSPQYDALPQALRDKLDALSTIDRQMRLEHQRNENKTKYDSYTLPGEKTSYTELLLTLPQRGVADLDKRIREISRWPHDSGSAKEDADQPELNKLNREWEKRTMQEFTSPHFEEKNIVAHVRFDGRTDADGKRVLFVEEVQSDWHQKGKKLGYKQPLDSSKWTAEKVTGVSKMEPYDTWLRKQPWFLSGAITNPEAARAKELYAEAKHRADSWLRHSYIVRDENGKGLGERYADSAEEALRQQESMEENAQNRTKVPDAPFKTDWHELAMKRMLRAAAENGYDKLAWVTGEQTADRYGISKQIESLNYNPDNQRLVAKLPSGSRHIDKQIPPEELPDYIGKEAAQRLLATEKNGAGNHELKGTGLKVGGEWAKALYDRAIPNFLNRTAKKWAAKAGESKVATTEGWDHEPSTYEGPNRSLREVEQLAELSHAYGSVHESPFTGRRQTFVINRVDVSSPLEEIRRQMRGGASFSGAMERSGTPELAEIFGGELKQGAVKTKSDTVHSIDITPEMKKSVMEEGQPLFHPYFPSFSPLIAKNIEFSVVPTKKNIAPYIRVNAPAIAAVSRSLGINFLGVNLDKLSINKVSEALRTAADTAEMNRGANAKAAARKLNGFADVLEEAIDNNPKEGVSLVREGPGETGTAHEELLHGVQRKAGEGYIQYGVPWREALAEPGMARMAAERIVPQLKRSGIDPHPVVIVAEGLVDIMRGDAAEDLSPPEAFNTAEKYFEAAVQQHGIEHLQDFQAVQDYISEREEALNVAHNREQYAVRSAGEAALARVLSIAAGGKIQPSRAGLPEAANQGQGVSGARPGEAGVGAQDIAGLGRKRPASTAQGSLFSTQPVGLTDDELEDWAKSKGFRYEPAGEQLGMFGGNDPLLRVFRQGPRGREQRGLIYQNQLDRLQAAKPETNEPFALTGAETREEQPRLFGAGDLGEIIGKPGAEPGIKMPSKSGEQNTLFSGASKAGEKPESILTGESGTLEPGKIGEAATAAAGAVGHYLRSEVHFNKIARELHSGMYDLESEYSGRVLEAAQTMQRISKEYGSYLATDAEAVYHHLENPESPLTTGQDELLDDDVLPIMADTDEKFTQLKELDGQEANLISGYVHRVVRGKGGWLDRIVSGMKKGTGRGNLLSKSAPQTKGRTMMAIESPDGTRKVVSIKGGKVTMWENGQPTELGEIKNAKGRTSEENETFPEGQENSAFYDEGKIVEGPDGYDWKITQATTKEIEANTEIEYYHNALASALVSNLQVGKALRGAQFIDAFKSSPQFKEIAWKQGGKGKPPEGWKITQLPQMKDYYFEPHTAEVLDWYAERIRGKDPGLMDKVGQFLRTAIFFNPLIHTPNIAVHWGTERGVTGYNPLRFPEAAKAGLKAINAVIHQNQDFLDALENGAPLQSHREDVGKITQLFFDQLTDGLEKKEDWAVTVAKRIGMAPVDLVKGLYRFSGKATWVTNDIAVLQSAYEKMGRIEGLTLKQALKETSKHIPDYRLPTRMLNSRALSKILSNPNISMFMAYHYGAAKSYGEAAKSALGAGGGGGGIPVVPKAKSGAEGEEPPAGRSPAAEAAHGWELLATIGLVTFVLYPLLDKLAQELTGDKNARMRRAGASTLPFNVYQAATHQKSIGDVIQAVATPAIQTKTAVELITNRDFYTGRNIYDPTADFETQGHQVGRFLMQSISPIGQASRAMEGGTEGWKRFGWGLAGVSFPKTKAERLAQQIAMGKVGTKAETPQSREDYVERHDLLEEMRKGNRKPLDEARAKHAITPAQAHTIEHRARVQPLADTVKGFSYAELMQVYNAATDDEKKLLDPIKRTKAMNLFKKGRGAEVRAVQ